MQRARHPLPLADRRHGWLTEGKAAWVPIVANFFRPRWDSIPRSPDRFEQVVAPRVSLPHLMPASPLQGYATADSNEISTDRGAHPCVTARPCPPLRLRALRERR